MRELIGFAAIGLGLFVHLSALVGMFRFRYVLNRMHAAALADTLGIGLVLVGCILLRAAFLPTVKFALLLVFLWLTAPISTHLIAKAEIAFYAPSPEEEKEAER